MNDLTNQILKIQQANKSTAKSKPVRGHSLTAEEKTTQQLEIEQAEQPEPVLQLESLAEPNRDESVYGSGWSLALIDERVWREMSACWGSALFCRIGR